MSELNENSCVKDVGVNAAASTDSLAELDSLVGGFTFSGEELLVYEDESWSSSAIICSTN